MTGGRIEDFERYMAARRSDVDAALDAYSDYDDDCPSDLRKAIRPADEVSIGIGRQKRNIRDVLVTQFDP